MSNKNKRLNFVFGIWHWHIYYIKSPFTSLVRHRWMIGLAVSKSLSALPYRHLNIIYINIIYSILEKGGKWSLELGNSGKFGGRKNVLTARVEMFLGSPFGNRLELLFSRQSYGQLWFSFEDIISNLSSNHRSDFAIRFIYLIRHLNLNLQKENCTLVVLKLLILA